jgi:Mrp family chromosome partitioning ATPase
MVNTRILEQQLGWRRGQPEAEGPRDLQHEPVLQGRIQAGGRTSLPAAAGLVPRGRQSRAAVADVWAALDPFADSLEAAAARRGALPPFGRDSAAGATLDQLRSALLRATAQHGWRRIGVASPRRGGGASFVALGLAASIARLDYLHLALVDLDLAQPSLHRHLGLPRPGPIEEVLRGRLPPLAATGRVGENLALLPNASPVAAAADLLHAPEAILALRGLADALQPDLMLFDLPPLLTDPAAPVALAQVQAVLLVADGTRTTARDITECERTLDGQTPLLGVVLNKSEDRATPASSG